MRSLTLFSVSVAPLVRDECVRGEGVRCGEDVGVGVFGGGGGGEREGGEGGGDGGLV